MIKIKIKNHIGLRSYVEVLTPLKKSVNFYMQEHAIEDLKLLTVLLPPQGVTANYIEGNFEAIENIKQALKNEFIELYIYPTNQPFIYKLQLSYRGGVQTTNITQTDVEKLEYENLVSKTTNEGKIYQGYWLPKTFNSEIQN